jgi:GTPase
VASAEMLAALRRAYPDAVVISARTGHGMDRLRAVIEARLPRPEVEVLALVPYERGDLIDRIHRSGELLSSEHTGTGTRLAARVTPALAGELARYAVAERA